MFLRLPANSIYTEEIKLKRDLSTQLLGKKLSRTERVKNAAALQYIYGHTAHFITSFLFSPTKMQLR